MCVYVCVLCAVVLWGKLRFFVFFFFFFEGWNISGFSLCSAGVALSSLSPYSRASVETVGISGCCLFGKFQILFDGQEALKKKKSIDVG